MTWTEGSEGGGAGEGQVRVLLPRHSMCHVDVIVIVGVLLRGSAVSSEVAGVRFEQPREVRFGGVIAELRLAREYR